MCGETFSVPSVSKGHAKCFLVSRGSIASVLPFYSSDGTKSCSHRLDSGKNRLLRQRPNSFIVNDGDERKWGF